MYKIIGSFSKKFFEDNFEKDLVKDKCSWSFLRINYLTYNYCLFQMFDIPSFSKIDKEFKYDTPNYFYIGCISDLFEKKNKKKIHPAKIGTQCMLFYEGKLSFNTLTKIDITFDMVYSQEAEAFLHYLDYKNDNFPQILNEIEGNFTCVYIRKHQFISIFRNEKVPLYVDNKLNFCSSQFENSVLLEPNYVFTLNPQTKKLEKGSFFLNPPL